MEDRIMTILENVLGVDLKLLEKNSIKPENIENWDSVAHLSIIVSLEEEFSLSFDADEIEYMQDGYNHILEKIKAKGIK